MKIIDKVITLTLLIGNASLSATDMPPERITIKAERMLTVGEKFDDILDLKSHELNTGMLADTLKATPGIALNGQGGIFQTVSIRGLSGWRVRSMIGDIPINTERRAGNALSFIDSLFIDAVHISKGPSSTRFGSGALGGVIQLLPNFDDVSAFDLDYEVTSGSKRTALSTTTNNTFWAFSYHDENSIKTANNASLFTSYQQTSFFSHSQWEIDDDRKVSFFVLPSLTTDIGKSSIDFPDRRITSYPRDYHTLAQLNVTDNDWGYLSVFAHLQKWQTQVDELDGRLTLTENKGIDSGLYWKKNYDYANGSWQYGFDGLRRDNVDVKEKAIRQSDTSSVSNAILSGMEQELGAFFNGVRSFERTKLSLGGRINQQWQEANNVKDSETSSSVFLLSEYTWSSHWSLSGKLSQGFRFPSLTERFFNGTTGRGTLIGNLNLQPEKSLNYELMLIRRVNFWESQWNLYFYDVDNFIERETISENVTTFVNKNHAQLKGIEWRNQFSIFDNSQLKFHIHYMEGEDNNGQSLNDSHPGRMGLTFHHDFNQDTLGLKWTYHTKNTRPGSSEVERSDYHVVDGYYQWNITREHQLNLVVENLFDARYFLTADDKATQAPKRSLTVKWKTVFL
ncbi:MAG: TonB-dependent receptor [Pseudomonadota bacterium]